MKEILEKLFSHVSLSRAEAKDLFLKILDGGTSPAQISAILTCFRMRQVSLEELIGFREAALQNSIKLNFEGLDAIDVCGTGGDNKNTFNISTISAFVIAACGIRVAKHGGAAVSSKFGSSNLLEALGYKFTNEEGKLKAQLENNGICFLHAPLFLPSFKHAVSVRKELGVKTIFNILGPVLNPSSTKTQVLGVYSLEIMRLYTYLAAELDRDFTVVHSLDGCDEISLTSEAKVSSREGEKIYTANDFGLKNISYADIQEGSGIEESIKIFHNVLDNKATAAQQSVVIANSGLAIYQVKKRRNNVTLIDCVEQAKEALISGKAKNVFKKLIEAA